MARSNNGGRYRMSATPALVMAQIFALAAITLMLVWILHFRGGLSLKVKNLDRLVNAHHVLMLFGPIISTGQAIMAFKTIPGTRKVRKIVHMLFNLMGIILGVLGLYAIFRDYEELHDQPNFFLGFTFFLFPGAKKNMRTDMKPWHVFFGLMIFTLAIFTSGTGLIQRFRRLGLYKGREALVLNFTGIAIILFGITVILSVILP